MAGQRRIGIDAPLGPAGARLFAIERIGKDRGDAIRAGVRQVEEVPCHLGSSGGMTEIMRTAESGT